MKSDFPEYEIFETLYESSRSRVYRGCRKGNQRPFILKVLNLPYPTSLELAQFRSEYELTRRLEGDGIIAVFDVEPWENTLLMTLEDFGGISFDRVKQPHRFDLTALLQLSIRITEIVGYIHQRNVIHKDLNPSNIVWNPQTNQVKIIDFGIAAEMSREIPAIRHPNVLEGTLAYMSPEQTGRMNRAMDYRTDLYSLGVTFYEMLTGQLPFQADDPMELVHCHLAKMPVPPSELLPRSPEVLSDIIMKLLAKNAEDRYQSTAGLKHDLEYCLKNLSDFSDSSSHSDLSNFIPGQHDFSARFQIPQKLYGREQDIDTLLAAFDRAATPEAGIKMIMVTGFSGIGKSSLIHEIHKSVVEKKGLFMSGKCDQFSLNMPYSVVAQAFRDICRQILSEPQKQLEHWRITLLQALGPNAQILIDLVPQLEFIIGKQPPIQELDPTESQNRFKFILKDFVRAFTDQEHPLAICLDDLQWADSGTLNLLRVLMSDSDMRHVLIIGAYRDNEVHEGPSSAHDA